MHYRDLGVDFPRASLPPPFPLVKEKKIGKKMNKNEKKKKNRAYKPVAFTIENKRKAEGETDTRAPAPRRAAPQKLRVIFCTIEITLCTEEIIFALQRFGGGFPSRLPSPTLSLSKRKEDWKKNKQK